MITAGKSKTLFARITRKLLAFALIWPATITYDMQTPANAQWCSVSAADLDFGAVDLSSGAPINTTATFQVFCIGAPGRTVRVCPNFNSGIGGASTGGHPRQMLSGVSQLNYNIYQNAGYSQVWGSHVWGWAPKPPTINLPLSSGWWLGFGSTTITMRGRISGGQNSSQAGFYTSGFYGGQTRVSYRYDYVGNCAAISSFGGVQAPFTVRTTVLNTCTINAASLNFGANGVLASNVDSSNTISINCNSGLPYAIGLDGGLSGASNPEARKMTNGPEQVTYAIYQNAARTQPWGNSTGINTVSSVGTGLNQVFTAYGRVPTQTTPQAGTYTDTVVVTVTY